MLLSPLHAALTCVSTVTEQGLRWKIWWTWGGGGTQHLLKVLWDGCSVGCSSISTGRRQAEKRHKGSHGGQVDQRTHSSCGSEKSWLLSHPPPHTEQPAPSNTKSSCPFLLTTQTCFYNVPLLGTCLSMHSHSPQIFHPSRPTSQLLPPFSPTSLGTPLNLPLPSDSGGP